MTDTLNDQLPYGNSSMHGEIFYTEVELAVQMRFNKPAHILYTKFSSKNDEKTLLIIVANLVISTIVWKKAIFLSCLF